MTTFKEFMGFGGGVPFNPSGPFNHPDGGFSVDIPRPITNIIRSMARQIKFMNPQRVSLPTKYGQKEFYVIPKASQPKLGRGATTPSNLQWLVHAQILQPDQMTGQALHRDGSMYVNVQNLHSHAKEYKDTKWWHSEHGREAQGQQWGSALVNAMNQSGQMPRYSSYGN